VRHILKIEKNICLKSLLSRQLGTALHRHLLQKVNFLNIKPQI